MMRMGFLRRDSNALGSGWKPRPRGPTGAVTAGRTRAIVHLFSTH
jgi:hypothetical protein